MPDTDDLCPNTPIGEPVDANGCSQSQLDSDGDGVMDSDDFCPTTPIGETVNSDGCHGNILVSWETPNSNDWTPIVKSIRHLC